MRLSQLFLCFMIFVLLPAAHAEKSSDETIILVHGAWGGGWDWKVVDEILTEQGATVYRPTLSGLGDRYHRFDAEIDLSTHVTDIVNLIRFEELDNVVLMGHSYGGMVITGVVEQVPERIARLVYYDAFVPYDGDCVLKITSPDFECDTEDLPSLPYAELKDGQYIAAWQPELGTPPGDVPHPARTFAESLPLESTPGRNKPALYILTHEVPGEPDGFDWAAERARELEWQVVSIIGDHVVHRPRPGEIASLILHGPQ